MDWFERLTGFHEAGYDETRRQLEIDRRRLWSRVNGCSYGIGTLELVFLKTLRERVRSAGGARGHLKVTNLSGDVRRLHQEKQYAGALFQVASQFLEMTSPGVCPEDGVTRYQLDPTQGPACAIAAGAATIYRNYFAPVGGQIGQTRHRQLDGLADLSAALSHATRLPPSRLWTMANGYALCHEEALAAIAGGSNIVLLTRLGGGAFGNANKWIDSAMRRALELVTGVDLDIRLVSFGPPPAEVISLEQAFA